MRSMLHFRYALMALAAIGLSSQARAAVVSVDFIYEGQIGLVASGDTTPSPALPPPFVVP